MRHLRLETETDTIDLNGVSDKGAGMEALKGVTGLGLPQKATQWLAGAGDGAVYRGRRVQQRDIDIPLDLFVAGREDLKALFSRLAVMLDEEITLRMVEDDGTDWSLVVHHVGGGDYVYGVDTIGETDLQTVITLRAGDPYWTYSRPSQKVITNHGSGRGLLGQLASMRLSASQAIGTIELDNTIGDAKAYPVWEIVGPGRNLVATSATGESFSWTGTLSAGETLIIDTKSGAVVDGFGTNRYASMGPAPRLWSIPRGTTTATASLVDVDSNSAIICTWRPRKWAMI